MADFLTEHAAQRARLVVDDHESIEMPGVVQGILHLVVEAMNRGQAVTVTPQSQMLTTQQAADLLGISRPTLIRLLEANQIPYEQIGSHRRMLLGDVLHYREQRRERQYQFLADTAVDPNEEENVDAVLERLRRVRQESKRR